MTRKQIGIEQKWRDTLPELNEKQRRHYAGRSAKAYGFGGVTAFARGTGKNRDTINQGIKELESGNTFQGNRIRRPGGGRKKLEVHQPGLTEAVEAAANPKADHQVLVKWTSHSTAHIAAAVAKRGFVVGLETIRRILHEQGFARDRPIRRTWRVAQITRIEMGSINHMNMQGLKALIQGFLILSVDAKKTEKIGNMKNSGREWTAPGDDTKVEVHDFGQKDSTKKGRIMKAIPYGVYDVRKQARRSLCGY